MPHSAVSTQQRNRAKELRHRMTRAETLLWRYLKAGRLNGLSFRRQTPIGDYIVDFVSHAPRIVVEVDGETHDFAARIRHDQRRDAWLGSRGYVVLRFTNDEVMRGLEGVLLTISETARTHTRSPPP
jgi:very-short-patch-repair endonuclease